MFILDDIIFSFDQLLQQQCILLIKPMYHIFVQEIAIQVLSLFTIELSSFLLFLVDDLVPIICPFELCYFLVLLPLVLGFQLEVWIILFVCFSCHAEVFQGKVSLLVDVTVVVLRDFWGWDVVLWPVLFYSWGLVNNRFERLWLFLELYRRLTWQGRLPMLNLPIDINNILILVELLYSRVLLRKVLLVHTAVRPAVVYVFRLRLFHAGWLGAVWGGVHWRFLLVFLHKVGLVWDCSFVGLRSVVEYSVRDALKKGGSDKLWTLLRGDSGSLLAPHSHLLFTFLNPRAAR